MPFYRIVFANDSVISCEEAPHILSLTKDIYHQYESGKLISAYIRADSPEDAQMKAKSVAQEATKFPGNV